MSICRPQGYSAAAVAAGIKPKTRRLDVALVVSSPPAAAAGCFTQNRVRAAPVTFSATVIARGGPVRAVIINAGNANACTGRPGDAAVRLTAGAVGRALDCRAQEVLVASTGVIGVALPHERLVAAVPHLQRALRASPQASRAAAQAIMTTDLVPKSHSVVVRLGKHTYTVAGMAKGSGMIHPNMATMLGLLTTDAPLSRSQCVRMLKSAVAQSFNAISVDGDTSTNDCVFLLANGAAGGAVRPHGRAERALGAAIQEVCDSLAEAIALDGEGARKLIVVHVKGASSHAHAMTIARTVVASPLVKTAVAGGDPNWGRVLAAAGRAGVVLRPTALALRIGGVLLAHAGMAVPKSERAAARAMKRRRVEMELTVGAGRGKATAKGCDLTHGYIDINAHYRT